MPVDPDDLIISCSHQKAAWAAFLFAFYNHLMSSLVFLLAWLTPNHYPPWVNFHSEFLAFLGLFFFLIQLLRSKTKAIRITQWGLGLALFAVIPWIQYTIGLEIFAGDAFVGSMYLMGLALAVVVGHAFASSVGSSQNADWVLTPAHILLSAGILSSMLALLQWLSLTNFLNIFAMHLEPGERVVANLGQPNQLASLLLMGLASLVVTYEKKQIGKVGLVLGVVFMTWILVLTQSRTALLGAGIVTIFLLYKFRIVESRVPGSYVLIWLAGFGIATVLLPFVDNVLLLGDPRSTTLVDGNGRAAIWTQSIYAILDAPWFGYGWNQSPAAQAIGALKHPGSLAFTNAHNLVLDLITWLGLPLGVLLSAAGVYWFATRIKKINTIDATYAMAIVLTVAVHSMLEFPFAYAYFLLIVGLFVGVIEARVATASKVEVSSKAGWATAAVFAVFGSYFCYEYLLLEEDYRVARFENLKIGRTASDYQRPNIHINTQMIALLSALRQPALPNMPAEQIENLRKVSLRFGYQPLVFKYAMALGLNGDVAGSSHQMLVIRSMFGERYYEQARADMLDEAASHYPQLNAVQLPR